MAARREVVMVVVAIWRPKKVLLSRTALIGAGSRSHLCPAHVIYDQLINQLSERTGQKRHQQQPVGRR